MNQSPFKETIQPEDFTVIATAKDYKQQLISAILSAKQRICIVALYLENDEAGAEIVQALQQAKLANPNLAINVLVDYHRASRGLIGEKNATSNRSWYQALQQQNAIIPFYGAVIKPRELLGVLHLKGIVIDDCLLYSGASINNIYLHHQDKYRLDRYFKIRSKALANNFYDFIEQVFLSSGNAVNLLSDDKPSKQQLKTLSAHTKKFIKQAQAQLLSQTIGTEGNITLTPLAGLGKRGNQLNQKICQLVREAQHSIRLYTPYFNMPRPLVKLLIKALKRGVKVEIVVGDKTANDFYISPDKPFNFVGIVPYVYETLLVRFIKRYQSFVSNGTLTIKLWKHQHNSFHLKGVAVDNKSTLLTGSNLNPRAWGLDAENGIEVVDEQGLLVSQFETEHQQIIQHTTQLNHFNELDSIKDYPEKPRKLIKRLRLATIDRLLKRLL